MLTENRSRLVQSSLAGMLSAAALLLAGPALAQTSTDVPDRFRLEVGGFRIGSATELSFDRSGGSRVDFESLNLPDNATRAYIEGFWRPWRRHQFSLSWYRNNRGGDPKTVERQFTWGDEVITVGSTITADVGSNYLSGVYRFAAYKNDVFEVGPSIGIGRLSIDAAISGEISVSSTTGGASRSFEQSRSLAQMTGDLGGYLYWWPIPRLLVRGEMRYILVKPGDAEASVAEGRAAVLYHPWRNLGFGLQYTYSKFRYDREVLSSELGGSLRHSGGQLVIAGTF